MRSLRTMLRVRNALLCITLWRAPCWSYTPRCAAGRTVEVRAKEFDFDQLLSDTQDKVGQPLGRRLRKADCMSMLVCSIQMTQYLA